MKKNEKNSKSQERLAEIQKTIKEKKLRWTAGETIMSKLTPEEAKKFLGNNIPEERIKKFEERQKLKEKKRVVSPESTSAATLAGAPPSAWDWRNVSGVNWTGAIRNQGGCGSCVAFAVAALVEMMIKKYVYDDPSAIIDASEAQMFFCSNRQCNVGDPNFGWWIPSALDYLKANGVSDENCFPYSAHNQPCNTCADWKNRIGHTKIPSWKSVTNISEMKSLLSTYGCLAADFLVYQDFMAYVGGVYEYDGTSAFLGGHAILVVGYNDTDGCWICKNSWGNWGDNGYFRVGYGEVAIDDVMYAIDVVNWQNGQQINTFDTSPYPASAVPFNNKLFVFWKANDYGNGIFYSPSADGNTWPNGKTINGADASPYPVSAVPFNNKLYAFFKSTFADNKMYYSMSTDGTSWPNAKTVNTVDTTPYTPFAVVFKNKIYLFWKSNDYDNNIYFSASTDGLNWPNGRTINNVDKTPYPTTAVPFNNKLYLFWKSNGYDNTICYSASSDGITWPSAKFTPYKSPYPPSATVFRNKLYLAWKANDYGNRIYYAASADANSWPNGRQINTFDTTPMTPSMTVFNNKLYLFWRANDPWNHIFFDKNDA